MKKPLLNLEQRKLIRQGTPAGAFLKLQLAFKKLERETHKNNNCFVARKKMKQLVKHINQVLFNR